MRSGPHDERAGRPTLPGHALERPRLVDRIDAGTKGRVTLVVAPAGYGKSVAVGQWRAVAADRTVAWVDLHRHDDDAVSLARSMWSALESALPEDLLASLTSAFDLIDIGGLSLGDEFVERLVRDLALVPDLVLVLDNVEVLRRRDLIHDLGSIITSAPANVHFVVISRSDPGIPLSRLRVAGDLTEIRLDALGMTVEEAADLLERSALMSLDEGLLDRIHARTAGWPAALQLAAITLRDAADPEAFVDRFSGDARHVSDYLTEEVLAGCGEDERRFLLETSVLDRMNPSLCDAVTGQAGSDAMLEKLERSGMLLARLDGPGRWYRYHPLLSDMLRTELEHVDPARHREVLLRASRWHQERGDITAAMDDLVRARAWDDLLDLTRIHGRDIFQQGVSTSARDAVDAIPASVRLASPHAMLTRAILHLLTGQAEAAHEELTRLEQLHDLGPWELTIVDVVRAAMVAWHLPADRAAVAGRRALDRLAALPAQTPQLDVLGLTSRPLLEIVAMISLGRACHYQGVDDEARLHLTRAAELSEGVFLPWYLHSLGAQAMVEALAGNLRAAMDLAGRVIGSAAAAGIDIHPATAEARLAIAIVRREQDDLDDASFALDEANAFIRVNHRGSLQTLRLAEVAWQQLAHGAVRSSDVTPPVPVPAFTARLVAAIARQRLAAHDVEGAALALAAHDGLRTFDIDVAQVAVAVARRQLGTAARLAERLDLGSGPRAVVEATIWRAVIDDLSGDRSSALRRIGVAAVAAEPDRLRRCFHDAGPEARLLVQLSVEAGPTPMLRSLVERRSSVPAAAEGLPDLVEQLTDREIAVLRYLPTRLSNVEIAQRLYVSLNTIKTHVKHIYRKLGVANRAAAVEQAERRGLL